ncbi:winged helix DNA-binding domain-containing protein [Geodermatophilus sp. TF02-6]|uniref:winged helix DNA-binding domain-containing protein n=1 Tax=Geodermatophilus sp. TF02-6 TaxID=2250575 RepID=UPI000DE8FA6F|nr:winged helix DNA-binding domain-containing protein [Geodermatophilus sp. TF02-6]RBY79574.1 winged helix DNA-binding domain-containing protein [Geodermatophilus sp. TF02-6]
MRRATGAEVLDRRTLNRATLERQLLLRRDPRTAVDAVEHLVGLQAQEPQEPYVGLWSRSASFAPGDLVDLLKTRRVVRTLLMRRTLHLVTAADCLTLRPVHQPMLVARMVGTLGRRLPGVDLEALGAAGQALFAEEPRTLPEVGRRLGDRWPGVAARDLGDALSSLVPLVQTPPRGLWRRQAPARNTTVGAWLGREPETPEQDDVLAALVLRYLRAHGPAAGADLRAWSGLSGLPPVVERLRPRFRTFRDERGRELLDVPDGPLPDGEQSAPVRFLPAFDNAVLGYDDRSRIVGDEHRGLSVTGARFVLVDGFVAATWTSSDRADGGVAVTVRPLRPLDAHERDGLEAEGANLAAFLGDGTPGSLTVADP